MRKNKTKHAYDVVIEIADELRTKLHEIDQKLEYLIKTFRYARTRGFDSSFDELIS